MSIGDVSPKVGVAPVSFALPICRSSAASHELCTIWLSRVTARSIRMSVGPVVMFVFVPWGLGVRSYTNGQVEKGSVQTFQLVSFLVLPNSHAPADSHETRMATAAASTPMVDQNPITGRAQKPPGMMAL